MSGLTEQLINLCSGIAALGFCFADHFGQCLAHFIMGESVSGLKRVFSTHSNPPRIQARRLSATP